MKRPISFFLALLLALSLASAALAGGEPASCDPSSEPAAAAPTDLPAADPAEAPAESPEPSAEQPAPQQTAAPDEPQPLTEEVPASEDPEPTTPDGSIDMTRANVNGGSGVAVHTQAEITAYFNAIGGYDTLYHPTEYTTAATDTTPGVLSDATVSAALATLNFVRYIAGISYDVTVNSALNEKAQAASFVNCLNGVISHYPSRPDGISDTLYTLAYNAAGQSNLGYGYNCRYTIGENIIFGWMDDSDSANCDRVGHRRWCLDPRMTVTGFGMSQSGCRNYAAMISYTDGIWRYDYTESNIAWPAANMPVELFDTYELWSLTPGYTVDPDSTSVTVTRENDGTVWHFSTDEDNCDGFFAIDNNSYGLAGCIIFQLPDVGGYNPGDEFTVSITTQKETIDYTVSFFSLSDDTPADPTPTPTPTAVPTPTPAAVPTAEPTSAAAPDPNALPESTHDYDANTDQSRSFTVPGAAALLVTFSEDTYVEDGYDYITVCDGSGNQIGRYTGDDLYYATVTVPGDTVVIRLTSDSSGTGYGYRVVSVIVQRDDGTLIGDINGDSRVNVVDALRLFRSVNGQIDPLDASAADLNGDEKVNIVDALRLFRYVNGQLAVL